MAVAVPRPELDKEAGLGDKRHENPQTEYHSGLATYSILSFSSKKIIDLPGRHINEPSSSGKHYSLPFLPASPSPAVLEGLFELIWRTSRPIDSWVFPRTTEIQAHRQACCVSMEVPRQRQD